MSLVDRRIGLLFARSWSCSRLAFARALYLGTVKGGNLARAANIQQTATEVVPPRRGSILDRRGIELAVSEPASDVSVTPYLVKTPERTAERLAPLLGAPESDILDRGHPRATRASSTSGVSCPPPRPTRSASSRSPGSPSRRPSARVPAPLAGLAGARRRRHRQQGPLRHRARAQPAAHREARRPPLRPRRARPGPRGPRRQPGEARPRRHADPRRPDPGPRRGDPARRRREVRPKGASAVVLDPRTNEVLAMANWPQVDANGPGDAPETAQRNLATTSPTSPARPSRRSRSPARSRTTRSRPTSSSTCRRRSRSPTGSSASRTTAGRRR